MKIQLAVVSIIVSTLLPDAHSAAAQWSSITANRLLSWLESSSPPLVMDVRGRSAYLTSTVPGAIDAGKDPLGFLPDDSKCPVVLIIPVDADAGFVETWFKRLANAGHEVWILEGGLAAWVAAGGPTEKPEGTYSLPGRVPFIVPKGVCETKKPALIFE